MSVIPHSSRLAALALAGTTVAAALPAVAPSTAHAERWVRPVPGEVTRPFSYARTAPFMAGAHRGVDLAAPPGAAVRAACGGPVVHAGPVAGRGSVVSVRCGGRRVSHLPLGSVAVQAGSTVRAGASLGTVAPGHGGLHVGVRREGDPFGYEDPAALLPGARPPFGPAIRSARPRGSVRRPAAPRPVPAPPAGWAPPARPVPARPVPAQPARPLVAPPRSLPAPRSATAPASASWPVWAGLVLLASGAAGSGTLVVHRRRRLGRRTATAGGPLA